LKVSNANSVYDSVSGHRNWHEEDVLLEYWDWEINCTIILHPRI
jgi:hypothetical protein